MPVDQSLVGRTFPPTPLREVGVEHVAAFARACGTPYAAGDPAPPTYPIVLAFEAMNAFLDDIQVELRRIVHGEQRFRHTRPIRPGDTLRAALTVASLRQIGGNDIIGTRSTITDTDGSVVCEATATLVHRGGAA